MKLSIVTAIKDGFGDFRRTLPTILGQTVRDFEWLLVDDGSATPLAQAFPELQKDSRVRLFRNEQGIGQTKSLNHAIREARGAWIVRMDGDDLARGDRLEKTLAAISPGAHLIFSDYSVIDGEDREWAAMRLRLPVGRAFFDYLQTQNNPVCHPTVSFRRERPGGSLRLFREDLVNAQDYALWKEILQECGEDSYTHVPEPLISYRIARESLSGARAREQKEELEAIRGGRSLEGVARRQAVLGDSQKGAMQAYRLLYYRFAGVARAATFREELSLLAQVRALPGQLPKALFFWAARPFRGVLLRALFGGIYR